MILYTVKLKLTSPILGVVRNHKVKYRTLMRNSSERVVIPQPHWHWGVFEALTTMRKNNEIYADCFRDLLAFSPPATHAYERKAGKNKEMFEAIRTGVVITTQLLVTDISPEEKSRPFSVRKRPPDKEDIESVLRYNGAFVGITQWGYKFGYGRFRPVEVTEATKEEIDAALMHIHFVPPPTDQKEQE